MNREILRLAIPNILSNISVPLISSFDTALMGGLGGTHIAAVGLGSMAFNFVYWNFGFLRMGTTGLTAQAYGRESAAEQAQALIRGALLALVIGLVLVLLQSPLVRFTEWLLNIRADQIALVEEYFFIRIIAAPAALLQMVLLGWFFGRQNAIWPLILTLVVNSCNLGLSYYLVAGLGWGIAGVAWGTVAAQYLGLLLGLGFLVYGKYRHREWPLSRSLLHLRSGAVSLGAFFRINRDIFIRTICLTLSFAFFYNRANALDATTATVAANVILLQLVNWLSYGVDGFAFAAESLVGKYAGAKRKQDLFRVIRLIFAWGMGLAGNLRPGLRSRREYPASPVRPRIQRRGYPGRHLTLSAHPHRFLPPRYALLFDGWHLRRPHCLYRHATDHVAGLCGVLARILPGGPAFRQLGAVGKSAAVYGASSGYAGGVVAVGLGESVGG